MNRVVRTVVNLLEPPVPSFGLHIKNEQQTPDLFLSSPHPLMWELSKPVLGDLWYSALNVTAFKNICYFRKCIKFLWTLGKG